MLRSLRLGSGQHHTVLEDVKELVFPAAASALPDPMSALSQVKQAPDYLRPEATRQLAAPVHRGSRSLAPALPSTDHRQASGCPNTFVYLQPSDFCCRQYKYLA